jgi:hypothetical protein
MRLNALYGSALIASSVMLVGMAVTHPAAVPLLASRQAFERFTLVNHLAHGLAIAGVWGSMVGLAGFSRMLGATRPSVTAAFVAFAISAAAILVAAAVDGFVVPQLASRWFDADQATRATLQQLMIFSVSVASALTRVYMTLGSAAILLWSVAAWRTRPAGGLPWLGVLVSIAAVAAAIGGKPIVSVHELLALVVGWTLWMAWAGIEMFGTPDSAAAGSAQPPGPTNQPLFRA